MFGGRGGQSPVFYNLLVALAALLILSRREALRRGVVSPAIGLAMLCGGIAITMKQTALCESVFWGCYVLAQLAAARPGTLRLLRQGLVLALIGAAPMALCAAIYAAIGHFGPFWQAMVTSNLTKTYNPGHDLLRRIWILWSLQSPAWLFAAIGLVAPVGRADRLRQLACLGWFTAALAGVFSIPNLHHHYVLPLLVPLSVMTAPFLQRGVAGPLLGLAYIWAILVGTSAFDFDRADRSNAQIRAMVAQIEARDPHPRLFVFDGPVYLYAMTGARPQSPLFFPQHLYFQPETNTSFLDTVTVVRDWLARRPSVIVIRRPDQGETRYQYNQTTLRLAENYAHQDCRWHFSQSLQNLLVTQIFDVYGGCGEPAPTAAAKPSGQTQPR